MPVCHVGKRGELDVLVMRVSVHYTLHIYERIYSLDVGHKGMHKAAKSVLACPLPTCRSTQALKCNLRAQLSRPPSARARIGVGGAQQGASPGPASASFLQKSSVSPALRCQPQAVCHAGAVPSTGLVGDLLQQPLQLESVESAELQGCRVLGQVSVFV